MPCQICGQMPGYADHRMCLVELFRSDTIRSVKEWEQMSSVDHHASLLEIMQCSLEKKTTIIKGKITVKMPVALST